MKLRGAGSLAPPRTPAPPQPDPLESSGGLRQAVSCAAPLKVPGHPRLAREKPVKTLAQSRCAAQSAVGILDVPLVNKGRLKAPTSCGCLERAVALDGLLPDVGGCLA
jgi:hypothetical protein